MSTNPMIFYALEEQTKTVFWTLDITDFNAFPYLFIGCSTNPNKKMAVSVFLKEYPEQSGYQIKQL
jgi:hypothetical protein